MRLATEISNIVTGLYPDATYGLMSLRKAALTSHGLDVDNLPLFFLNDLFEEPNEIQPNATVNSQMPVQIYALSKMTSGAGENEVFDEQSFKTDLEFNTLIETLKVYLDKIFINIYQLDDVKASNNALSKYTFSLPIHMLWGSKFSGIYATANWQYNRYIDWTKYNV